MSEAFVSFQDVSKIYRSGEVEIRAVDDISFEIRKGEFVVIVGPSGAGKTTVFNLLTKVYQPTQGTILLDGQDTSGMSTAQVNRAGIARTFQNIRLFDNLTVEENVTAAMDSQMKYNMWSGIFRLPSFRREEKIVRDRTMELLEKDVVIFTLYPDKPAEMVFDAEDIVTHDGIFGITCENWQNIHDTIPARDVYRRFLEAPGDAYAVMQLKGSAPAELRYTGLNYLSQPPSPGNYDILYTGPIVCAQNQSATLENLFEIFNINRPGDFTGHSLSVSDIIALKQDGVVSYHYCDSVGFQALPGFMSENYLKAAEMSLEDDYSMIDGIINNGKQPISLMDGTERNPQEKKPSVLKKLKEQPPQSASERKPRKTKEKEI